MVDRGDETLSIRPKLSVDSVDTQSCLFCEQTFEEMILFP